MKLFVLCAAMVVVSRIASADLLYNLTVDSACTGGCGTSPYGSVDLTQSLINPLDVTVTVQLSDGYLIKTGNANNHETFAWNITTTIDAPPINTILLATETPQFSADPNAPGSPPAYGTFDYGINGPSPSCTGSNTCASSLIFDVGLQSGDLLPIADFVANGAGFFFEADIYSIANGNTGEVGGNTAGVCGSDCGTGGGGPLSLPEPVSFVLMGSGLALVGLLRLRRR